MVQVLLARPTAPKGTAAPIATARYLIFLTACGYTLADVERRASRQPRSPTTTPSLLSRGEDAAADSGGEATIS